MFNPFQDVNWHPDIAGRRAFAKSIAFGVPLVALILGIIGWLRTDHWSGWTMWLAGAGAAAGLLFWLAPWIARPFYILWHALGCAIGFVVSNVLLTAVYYLVVTPIGLLLRIAGRDPLERRFEPERSSYWKDAEKVNDAERSFRQY